MDSGRIHKRKVEVKVELDDGTTLLASLFLLQQQRVSDLLNDNRRFLPLETSEGIITNLRKTAIHRVTPIEQDVTQDLDAYGELCHVVCGPSACVPGYMFRSRGLSS